jgi:hypothetical protein
MGAAHFATRSTFHSIHSTLELRMINEWLLAIAWGAGLASLFLTADMIKTDIACRKAERVALRGREHAGSKFTPR